MVTLVLARAPKRHRRKRGATTDAGHHLQHGTWRGLGGSPIDFLADALKLQGLSKSDVFSLMPLAEYPGCRHLGLESTSSRTLAPNPNESLPDSQYAI